jgi:oligopeptide/dipeptide ABC transporter ATP-binding protein
LHGTSDSILTIRDLCVETLTGNPVIDQVSLQIRRGEVLGLVGESGSGKTTLAMALLGHSRNGTQIVHGSVEFEGIDILKLSADALQKVRGARISYVPQDPISGLNPRHRVGDQLSEVLLVHGASREAARNATVSLLQRVGLAADRHFVRRYPFELSGGQQQRIAIAMALACRPGVVVLDEPTTGLDVTTQARVLQLIRELNTETNAAFVYVTHDLAVVDNLADRVCIMYAGRIVEKGPRSAIFHQPTHPYTSLLLQSIPILGERRRLLGISGTAPPPGKRPLGCFFEPRCPVASEICRREFPSESNVAGDHGVRCWHAAWEPTATATGEPIPQSKGGGKSLFYANHLKASYGKSTRRNQILNDVSFSIMPGECLALVGESGSGKTTLGRCIAGLHIPDGGELALRESALDYRVSHRTPGERRAIQLVYQNPERSLNPRETVGRAISRPLRLYGSATTQHFQRLEAIRLLERVRLPKDVMDYYPADLSGGEKQRVAVARALAARPDLLVCDEVTSSLDVSIQAAIVSLLEELRHDGLALLFITHNLALVSAFADRVLVLQKGRVRAYGETVSVISRPTDPYMKELVAAVPRLSSHAEGRVRN